MLNRKAWTHFPSYLTWIIVLSTPNEDDAALFNLTKTLFHMQTSLTLPISALFFFNLKMCR